MKTIQLSAVALAVAGMMSAGAGCHSESPPGAETKATPAIASPTTRPAVTATTPAAPAIPDKDLTHVLAADEPYYATPPAQGKAADGTLKAGTKVLVVMPRGGYSQVMTPDGRRVYTSTAGLQPVGK
jgi:hypothetical protein